MLDKNLFKLLGGNKKYIFITVALQILGLLANIAITASFCWIIKILIEKQSVENYLYPGVCILIAIVIRYITARLIGDIKDLLGRSVKKDLRKKVYDKTITLGIKSTEDLGMAGLTQVSIEGIEQLDLYFSSFIPQFFYSVSAPLILFIVTVFIDWRSSLVLLACVPLIPISIMLVSKWAKKIFAKYWDKYISMGGEFLDAVQGLKELKIYRADARWHKKINQSSEDFRKITMKVLVMQLSSTTIMDIVAYGGAGLGIAISILGAAYWGLSPLAALFMTLVAVEFFLPLRAFGSAFHVAMNGASAGNKILAFLEKPNPQWGSEDVQKYDICLQNVSFSYDGQKEVLKNINIDFFQRGMTAIVGESGCGKSTIVNLIMGSYRPQVGQVLVGEKNLELLSRDNWYSHLAVISHNTYIFNTTVKENFISAKSGVSDQEIYAALEKVNLLSFIQDNGGLNMVINEDGSNLSGGQKQRLALAVNLVANKDIYVFDEATSNIDIESEAVIMQNILNLANEKCVIVISHRLANVVAANQIYYMENGIVTERGTHLQLLQENGGYKKLFSTQKQLEEGYIL